MDCSVIFDITAVKLVSPPVESRLIHLYYIIKRVRGSVQFQQFFIFPLMMIGILARSWLAPLS